jgi:hypothetical protein
MRGKGKREVATAYLINVRALQAFDERGLEAGFEVAVAQLPLFIAAPTVHIAFVGHTHRESGAARHHSHLRVAAPHRNRDRTRTQRLETCAQLTLSVAAPTHQPTYTAAGHAQGKQRIMIIRAQQSRACVVGWWRQNTIPSWHSANEWLSPQHTSEASATLSVSSTSSGTIVALWIWRLPSKNVRRLGKNQQLPCFGCTPHKKPAA